MDRSFVHSRRSFVKLGASAAAFSTLAGLVPETSARAVPPSLDAQNPWLGLKMGIATYTLSKLKLDAAIEAIRRVDLHYASIKDAHLSLKSPTEERQAVARKFREAGITPLSCGNITPGDKEEAIRAVFEYARDAGIPTIVCSPTKTSIATYDKLVKEFDIKVAIHNHGPEDKLWPSPFDAWEAVQSYDPRVGLCIDVGHTARTGVDPIDAIRKCAPRLHDLHIKDIAAPSGSSKPVELGRGVLDLRGILQALLDIKYAGLVGLEFEKNLGDPVPGMAESIGYLKGVLSGMKALIEAAWRGLEGRAPHSTFEAEARKIGDLSPRPGPVDDPPPIAGNLSQWIIRPTTSRALACRSPPRSCIGCISPATCSAPIETSCSGSWSRRETGRRRSSSGSTSTWPGPDPTSFPSSARSPGPTRVGSSWRATSRSRPGARGSRMTSTSWSGC